MYSQTYFMVAMLVVLVVCLQSVWSAHLSVAANSSTSSGCTPGDTSFDNLILVEQWPATNGISTKNNAFTLHGLWPSRTGTNVANYPCNCTNQTFIESAVSSIESQLNKYWISNTGDNVEFWTHEYEKHGTCAESIDSLSTELKFMSGALQLRSQLNTVGMLQAGGITPSSTATYTIDVFEAAVDLRTIFHCKNSEITEVSTCWNKSLVQVDCDENAYGGSNCPASGIKLPPVGSIVPSPSSSPTPSTSEKCVKDEHGPKCQSNSDCTVYTDCIRCAHSGYCTSQPDKGI
jgi:ribonuclease T2